MTDAEFFMGTAEFSANFAFIIVLAAKLSGDAVRATFSSMYSGNAHQFFLTLRHRIFMSSTKKFFGVMSYALKDAESWNHGRKCFHIANEMCFTKKMKAVMFSQTGLSSD